MTIKITPATTPVGKVADAELHFTDGPLAGLKLVGFAVWQRRASNGLNVTFPARAYSVNGERRSFGLLRAIDASDPADMRIRAAIIEAYEASIVPAPAAENTEACRCTHTRAQHTVDGACSVMRIGSAPAGSEQPCGCVAFQVWE